MQSIRKEKSIWYVRGKSTKYAFNHYNILKAYIYVLQYRINKRDFLYSMDNIILFYITIVALKVNTWGLPEGSLDLV